MKLVVLTPHNLRVFNDDGEVIREIKSMGNVRVSETITRTTQIDGLTFVNKEYEKANLPVAQDGTLLVVSKIVQDAHPERSDLVVPDTGPDSCVRDAQDRIVGVKRLQLQKGQ